MRDDLQPMIAAAERIEAAVQEITQAYSGLSEADRKMLWSDVQQVSLILDRVWDFREKLKSLK